MFGVIKSNYEYFNSEYADLVGLYIDPNFQRKGIGSTFKKMFEKWAKKNGAKKYVIGVLKDNKKARNIYELWGANYQLMNRKFAKLGKEYKEVFYTFDL